MTADAMLGIIGNGVVANCAEWIARRLIEAESRMEAP